MQELFEDITAIRKGIEALSKRVQEQGQPVSQAQVAQLLQEAKQGTRFTINYEGVAQQIQPHLTTPEKVETTLATGTKQLEQVVNRIPKSVPVVGQVWGFTDWRLLFGVVVLVLGLTVATVYAWQAKAERDKVAQQVTNIAVAYRDSLRRERTQNDWLVSGYLRLNKVNPALARKTFQRPAK
ncbi:hypothetical protein [Hymenobacter glacieicola]|uniref:Uncharacterized protein n=1 Tax=Hymenobacter glacieicola TaxID=1562124 RepID=A0ABQ1X6M2_9BACT|nr:hypothetical protein [Hymenobacter glacieicola]GGG62411.1 hypothetical protein GCM10011378_43180 [Hymenobacter glacieicola]